MFRVDDPRSEPRVRHELTLKEMAEDAEGHMRVSMEWRLLRLSAKILALLRLSVNFFQLRLTKKLKINLCCYKELNINKPVFFVSSKQNKGFRIISG